MRWLTGIVQYIRRKRILRLFRTWDIKYRAKLLGEALAKPDDGFHRKHNREQLHKKIHETCEENNVRHDDLKLVEVELNDYINGLVTQAYEKEEQRQKAREFIDTRIRIKGADWEAEDRSPPLSESQPQLPRQDH